MGETLKKYRESDSMTNGILVNSFEELEPKYVEGYKKAMKNKTLNIGPLFLANSIKSGKDNKASNDEHNCLKWLDSRKASSILYVCFGTLSHIKSQQLMEIGLGLEASTCSFIWVIRKANLTDQLEKLLEETFEERIQGRGLIVRGWAPQVSILSHTSVGGFVTHCGWNSIMESVSAGKPMIAWPMFAGKFLNEKLIVHILKIGMRVGVEVSVSWAAEQNVDLFVKREDIKKAIDKLMMDAGKEAEERRKRARELGKLAKTTVQKGGSSHLNVQSLIQ